ncbi:sensor domain-containing protein [Rhodococcus erythropolis]|uniref:sensor domain-containing protein n=1 Tax=Rhodococcus erythropolis TaxID=1833 RepID=UPI0020930445|nr:sensor domain-containing protein [Rhodococcus erythropolis]
MSTIVQASGRMLPCCGGRRCTTRGLLRVGPRCTRSGLRAGDCRCDRQRLSGAEYDAAPKSSTPKSTSPKTAAPLSELLLTPEEFPEPFGAVVLPPQAVPMAAPDLVGVPRGATVDPSECEPPEQDYGPNGTVMAVGTDNATRATISVELTKVDAPLDELEAQTRQCPSMTVTANGVTTTVTTEILPPSPIDADKTMSLRRTVVSPKAAAGDQTMLTLIAQVGDVQVATTLMTFGSATPSTAPLDQAFTAAVQKVKAGK